MAGPSLQGKHVDVYLDAEDRWVSGTAVSYIAEIGRLLVQFSDGSKRLLSRDRHVFKFSDDATPTLEASAVSVAEEAEEGTIAIHGGSVDDTAAQQVIRDPTLDEDALRAETAEHERWFAQTIGSATDADAAASSALLAPAEMASVATAASIPDDTAAPLRSEAPPVVTGASLSATTDAGPGGPASAMASSSSAAAKEPAARGSAASSAAAALARIAGTSSKARPASAKPSTAAGSRAGAGSGLTAAAAAKGSTAAAQSRPGMAKAEARSPRPAQRASASSESAPAARARSGSSAASRRAKPAPTLRVSTAPSPSAGAAAARSRLTSPVARAASASGASRLKGGWQPRGFLASDATAEEIAAALLQAASSAFGASGASTSAAAAAGRSTANSASPPAAAAGLLSVCVLESRAVRSLLPTVVSNSAAAAAATAASLLAAGGLSLRVSLVKAPVDAASAMLLADASAESSSPSKGGSGSRLRVPASVNPLSCDRAQLLRVDGSWAAGSTATPTSAALQVPPMPPGEPKWPPNRAVVPLASAELTSPAATIAGPPGVRMDLLASSSASPHGSAATVTDARDWWSLAGYLLFQVYHERPSISSPTASAAVTPFASAGYGAAHMHLPPASVLIAQGMLRVCDVLAGVRHEHAAAQAAAAPSDAASASAPPLCTYLRDCGALAGSAGAGTDLELSEFELGLWLPLSPTAAVTAAAGVTSPKHAQHHQLMSPGVAILGSGAAAAPAPVVTVHPAEPVLLVQVSLLAPSWMLASAPAAADPADPDHQADDAEVGSAPGAGHDAAAPTTAAPPLAITAGTPGSTAPRAGRLAMLQPHGRAGGTPHPHARGRSTGSRGKSAGRSASAGRSRSRGPAGAWSDTKSARESKRGGGDSETDHDDEDDRRAYDARHDDDRTYGYQRYDDGHRHHDDDDGYDDGDSGSTGAGFRPGRTPGAGAGPGPERGRLRSRAASAGRGGDAESKERDRSRSVGRLGRQAQRGRPASAGAALFVGTGTGTATGAGTAYQAPMQAAAGGGEAWTGYGGYVELPLMPSHAAGAGAGQHGERQHHHDHDHDHGHGQADANYYHHRDAAAHYGGEQYGAGEGSGSGSDDDGRRGDGQYLDHHRGAHSAGGGTDRPHSAAARSTSPRRPGSARSRPGSASSRRRQPRAQVPDQRRTRDPHRPLLRGEALPPSRAAQLAASVVRRRRAAEEALGVSLGSVPMQSPVPTLLGGAAATAAAAVTGSSGAISGSATVSANGLTRPGTAPAAAGGGTAMTATAAGGAPAHYGTVWQAMGAQDLPPGVLPDDYRAVKAHVDALVAARTRLQETVQRERVLLTRARSDVASARRIAAMLRVQPSPLLNLAKTRISALGASAGDLLPGGVGGGHGADPAYAGVAHDGMHAAASGPSAVLDAHASLLAAFAGIVTLNSSSILSSAAGQAGAAGAAGAGGGGSAGPTGGAAGAAGAAAGGVSSSAAVSADPSTVLLSSGPAAVTELKHRVLEAQARLLLILAQRQRRVADAEAAARRGADETEALRTEIATLRGRAAALRERLARQATLAAHGFTGTATSAVSNGIMSSTSAASLSGSAVGLGLEGGAAPVGTASAHSMDMMRHSYPAAATGSGHSYGSSYASSGHGYGSGASGWHVGQGYA